MRTHPQERFGGFSFIEWSRLPFRERIVDRLADLLLNVDDILEMLQLEDRENAFRWLEPDLRQAYENVNEQMKLLCD